MLWNLLRAAFLPRSGPDRLVRRGLALRAEGQLAEAEQVLRAALRQFPRDAAVATNLAIVLLEQDRGDEGVALLEQALICDPQCAAAHYNLANVLRASGRLDAAIAHYSAAADPQSGIAPAGEELMHTLLEVCAWERAQTEADRLRALMESRAAAEWLPCVSPLTAAYLELDFARRRQVATHHAPQPAASPLHHGAFAGGSTARIRIGYLSRDFRNHPVGQLVRAVFGMHDRSRFEVFAFSYGPDDGSVYRADIAAGADHFIDIAGRSDRQAAQAIAAAGIHVLIDLAGHTTGGRLGIAALRPAPVQAHYLGYPGTTGAAYIDYFVTDEIATPPHLAAEFSEQLAYLPRCFMVGDDRDARAAPETTRAVHSLPEQAFVYCNFANSSRITRGVFSLWMEILRAVPSAVLWLRQSHELIVNNLRAEAGRLDVDPARLIFARRVPDKPAHLARLRLADLALDTVGWYNGHSSSSDLLWAGVPLLTAPGSTFASRVAASLVHAAGLPELAAGDARGYVRLAVELGSDPARCGALRQRLIENRNSAPFYDSARIVADLEAAYAEMWRVYADGQPPRTLHAAA